MLEDIVEKMSAYIHVGIRHTLMVNIYLPESLQLGTEVNMLYRVISLLDVQDTWNLVHSIYMSTVFYQGTQWRERRENEVELERFFLFFSKSYLARPFLYLGKFSYRTTRERRISRCKK